MNSRPLRDDLFEMKQQKEELQEELQATEDRAYRNEANQKCAQTVTKFYEECLTWHTGAQDKDNDD